MKKYIFCLLALLLSGCHSGWFDNKAYNRKFVEVRPLKIYVYDEETKEPLQGISVVNIVEAKTETVYFVDSATDTKTFVEEYRTDENGCIEIPLRQYQTGKKYYLATQDVYVNIHTTAEWEETTDPRFRDVPYFSARMSSSTSSLTRPNRAYEGAVQSYWHFASSEYNKTEPCYYGTFSVKVYPVETLWYGKYRSQSFSVDEDSLDVYLRKYGGK